MRIGGMTGGRSRRQKRRDKEQEDARGRMVGIDAPVEQEVKPAKVEGLPPIPDVLTSTNTELVRKRKTTLPLPDQKELIRKSIVHRHQVEIVVDSDPRFDEVEVRQTLIEDIDAKNRLFLAQTSPPFLRSHVGRFIEPTFLSKYYDLPGGRWIRVGYRTQILDVVRDYKLASEERVVVVVIDPPTKLTPTTVRMNYRIAPPDDLDLRLVLWPDGEPFGLMDMSNGGLQFYHDKKIEFKVNQPLSLALISGGMTLVLPCKVIRSGKGKNLRGYEIGITSVTFGELKPQIKANYQQLIHTTYRHLLAQRSGVKSKY